MKFSRQTTLRSQATVTGVGVHSGLPVNLTLGPAPVDAGFIFVRTGPDGCDREVQATAESVTATEFATVLGDREGPLVSTAEHVLAALRGMGVDNATIEIDGPEVPIMDGSAAAFVAAIVSPERFRREISRARTFGCMNDVARLWSAGFALGASFENSVVFDETRLLNTEGLRYADECVRHKVLDVIGDLALSGLPLLGAYRSVRGGHKLNHAVLTALMADRSAWRVIEAETARRSRTHAEAGSGMVGGMIAPAYGPDVS